MNTNVQVKEEENKILFFLFLLAFCIRIPLINWYSAEHTDAICLMTLFSKQFTSWPPLYSFVIKAFNLFLNNLETSGQFASILSGSLVMLPIYGIGKLIFDRKTGIYASILYLFSPVALSSDLRVATDSLFTLLFLASLLFLLKFWFNPEARWLLFGFFLAGLASLTRYQGFALVPLIISLGIREIKEKRYKSVLISFLGGVIPWLLLGWWVNYRGFGNLGLYQERVGKTVLSTLSGYLSIGESFVVTIPYMLTYPIFAFFCYGVHKAKNLPPGRVLLRVFFYLLILWLIAHSAFRILQTRYFLPLIPLFLLLAGYGFTRVRKERLALGICLAISIFFSSAVLFCQRDSFGDVKRTALWTKNNVKAEVIFSDEFHKTAFWSTKEVKYLDSKDIKTGDYLVVHSFYSNLSPMINYLQKKYEVEVVYETTSRIIPLLPDLLNPPILTNTPAWLAKKYQKQTFKSIILKVLKEKE